MKRIQIEELLSHLNKQHERIKFTVEIEQNGRLPIMDLLLQRRDDGSLDTNVYKKWRRRGRTRFGRSAKELNCRAQRSS